MLKKVSYSDIFRFAWDYWRRRKTIGLLSIAFMLTATAVDVAVPVYTGKAVDAMSSPASQDRDTAILALGTLLALIFIVPVLRYMSFLFYNRWECLSMRDLLADLLNKVQRFSSNWHANNFAGATVTRITRARRSFEMFEDTIFHNIMPAVLVMFGMSGMLIWAVPSVGYYVLGAIFVYVGFSVYMSVAVLARNYAKAAAADTNVGAALADTITGNPTVKAFGTEKDEDRRFFGVAEDWRYKAHKAYSQGNHVDIMRNGLRFLMIAGALFIVYALWVDGRATAGNVTLVITAFFMISGYLRDIGIYVFNLQRAISEMEDAVYFWKTDIAVKDKPNAVDIQSGKGEIVFDKVTFAYGKVSTPIYDDFSLTIHEGEKVALVGHSGSGKSTFVKLVQRLYDIQGGEIRIDGQNIADVTQGSLRRTIALVPQEPILFHRSLAENIAYGHPGASQEEIEAAAEQAYAHDFISGLEHGYDTLVGERGIKLSGGERQRVAIARAILADAPILILDEATSSLDSVSEHYIQKALENLMKGRTSITIAHRLSTIKSVDRILVFDQGRIVEQGTHAELIARDQSHYKTLYEIQALGLMD